MTREEVEVFEKIYGQMEGVHVEISALAKKSPNDGLNKFKLRLVSASKVKLINRVLEDVISCVEGETFAKYLELLDDEALPQYSDAILVLSQHEGALQAFRGRHYGWYMAAHQWVIGKKR